MLVHRVPAHLLASRFQFTLGRLASQIYLVSSPPFVQFVVRSSVSSLFNTLESTVREAVHRAIRRIQYTTP